MLLGEWSLRRLPGGGDTMEEPGLSKGMEGIVQVGLLLAFPQASCVPLHRTLEITCL